MAATGTVKADGSKHSTVRWKRDATLREGEPPVGPGRALLGTQEGGAIVPLGGPPPIAAVLQATSMLSRLGAG